MKKVIGECLCTSVKYEIKGKLGPVYHCHCSKCRRWHGAAFRTRASIRADQLVWHSGEELLSSHASSSNVTKYFCRTCGSPMHSTYRDRPNVLGIPLGALEGLDNIVPQAHIFVGSKASWLAISDDIPQYDTWPGSESNVRETEN